MLAVFGISLFFFCNDLGTEAVAQTGGILHSVSVNPKKFRPVRGRKVHIEWHLVEDAVVDAYIGDLAGRVHRTLYTKAKLTGGKQEIKMNRVFFQAIYVLWIRDLKRTWRAKSRIIGSLMMPIFFLLFLGSGFRRVCSPDLWLGLRTCHRRLYILALYRRPGRVVAEHR